MHTLDTILDYVHSRVQTHEQYAQLPQDIKDLYEEKQQILWEEQMAWNEKCQREDEERARQAEQARLQEVWDAIDNGSSESPCGGW
tara:strand:- start:308 stop:565 length:258 start_codon:yes stop_codon:yes gene_type:complete